MEECRPILNTGLRGFTVATTRISHVDKAAEKLIYRGYLASELAKNSTYEEVVYLLLYEKLPDTDPWPLYRELHTYFRYALAEKYGEPEWVLPERQPFFYTQPDLVEDVRSALLDFALIVIWGALSLSSAIFFVRRYDVR